MESKKLICLNCEHCYHDIDSQKAGRKPNYGCMHSEYKPKMKQLEAIDKQPADCPLRKIPKLTDKGTLAPVRCSACEGRFPEKNGKNVCTIIQPAKPIDDIQKIPSWCPRDYCGSDVVLPSTSVPPDDIVPPSVKVEKPVMPTTKKEDKPKGKDKRK